MKKTHIIFIGILMAFALQVTAQIEKGTFLFGMSSAYSTPMTESNFLSLGYVRQTRYDYQFKEKMITETWSFNVLPKVGYFVATNLAVGLNGGFSYSSTTNSTGFAGYRNRTLGLGPFIRYYLKTTKVLPVVEAGVDYWKQQSYSKFEMIDTMNVSSTHEYVDYSQYLSFNIGAGIAIPIAQKASFDLLLTYSSMIREVTCNNLYGEFSTRSNSKVICLRFGFVFFLAQSSSSNQSITN